MDELKMDIELYKPHIIGITETWGKQTVTDGILSIPDYDLFRRDHDGETSAGGVMLLCHKSLQATSCYVLNENQFNESIWCKIKLTLYETILIGVCYRSCVSSSRQNNRALNILIEESMKQNVTHRLLMGDFNYPQIKWEEYRVEAEGIKGDDAESFYETSQDLFLHQHVIETTRHKEGQRPSMLDLYTCSRNPIGSDEKKQKNYAKGDYERLNDSFGKLNWDALLDDKSCNQAWETFMEIYNAETEKYIPKRSMRKNMKPVWLKARIKKSIKKKHKLYKKYRQTNQYKDYLEYKKQRNVASANVRKARIEHEQKLMKNFKKNPKPVYKYIREQQKVKEDGDLPQFDSRNSDNILENIVFSVEDVQKKLNQQQPNKAPGPDGVHPMVLNQCASSLAHPLTIIFKLSLETGKLPKDWKTANVTPIFKKGSKKKAENYRPISLTSIPCKVFESIIKDNVLGFVKGSRMLSRCQHGFLSGRSCLTNLLQTFETVTEALDSGEDVDIVYLDYMKAFDSVPHRRLIHKLIGYGISGKTINWIAEFLAGRTQKVIVRNTTSKPVDVVSGVPQGSVLGPILFILFINDLPDKIISADFNMAQEWSEDWLLKFNTKKCEVLHAGRKTEKSEYCLNGETLLAVNEEKDLGVIFTSDCKPSRQCAAAAARATNSMRTVKRTFKNIDKESFQVMYKAYIRPHMEYCIQSWSPYYNKDKEILEKVQRRATKMVKSISDLPYEKRLEYLDLQPLETRRLRGDLIEAFKILKGFEDIDPKDLFKLSHNIRTRGHSLKLYRPKLRGNLMCRANFFTIRVIHHWNSLPEYVIQASSVNIFKSRLDNYFRLEMESNRH
ncbi:uncharacterized protein [Antedon mediterranea]|uniref:uncharacterized protein n=1 Tax=Antedon mediterranea TaxID=105859 RepID=UPI003AF4EF8B